MYNIQIWKCLLKIGWVLWDIELYKIETFRFDYDILLMYMKIVLTKVTVTSPELDICNWVSSAC